MITMNSRLLCHKESFRHTDMTEQTIYMHLGLLKYA